MNPGTVRYRLVALIVSALAAVVYLSPLVLPESVPLPSFLSRHPINLGLDLRGGTHLLFAVDVDKAVENSVGRTADELRRALDEEGIPVEGIEHEGKALVVRLKSPDDRTRFDEFVSTRFAALQVAATPGASLTDVRLTLDRAEERRIRRFAVEQSLETIRNRVDQFGVAEPTIQRQGEDEIVVQLPGVQDPQRAKQLIGRTAVLEFHLVAEPGETPEGETIEVPAAKPSVSGQSKFKLEKKVLLTGAAVADARVRPGTQLEGPYVELVLSDAGARDFERITGENVNRRLAIVLDGKVFSAPVIREKIGGGRAQITGHFDLREARDLAIVLRAGALPAPIHIVEERTVGPSLGRDSVWQGSISLVIGGVLVIAFMAFYYRGAGILADLALVLNVLYMLALLAWLGATLTLPGIAGIVLTMGMAVDANVLINERIREEIRLGKTPRAAVEAGYERAWAAIRDSNLTTFVSGLILFQFGSGPVKGFAVTLCLGIATTVLTAVFGTRIYYDLRLGQRRLTAVSV